MNIEKIYKPVFIIGLRPFSVPTLIYDLLAYHKDFTWISNYSNRYYLNFPPVVEYQPDISEHNFENTSREKAPYPLVKVIPCGTGLTPVKNSPNVSAAD